MNTDDKKKFEVLQKYLRQYEREIIFYSKPFDNSYCTNSWGEFQIDRKLSIRADILNKMFALHATDAELEKVEKVNNMLIDLTEQLCSNHHKLQRKVKLMHRADGFRFSIHTSIDPYIKYGEAPELDEMEEDAFYESKWKEMIWCISGLKGGGVLSCEGDYIPDFAVYNYEWDTPFNSITRLKGVNICFLFHTLCTERKFSIPDVLRIKNYKIEQEICNWENDTLQKTI